MGPNTSGMAAPHLRPVSGGARTQRTTKRNSLNGVRHEQLLTSVVLALVCFGLVMVYSASSSRALLSDANPFSFVVRQAVFAGLGFGVYWVCTRMNLDVLKRLSAPLMVVSFVLLAAVFLPGIGQEINGSRRWLALPVIGLQPAELAKIGLIIWVAALVSQAPGRIRTLNGLMPVIIVTGLFSMLIIVEPDVGTAATLLLVVSAMLLVAGAQPRHLGGLLASAGALATIGIAVSASRRERLLAFLDPSADPGGTGFQILQARIAFGSGGLFGKGLGDGVQKANYLPEAQTDMILANIGEELGLFGVLLVILAVAAVAFLAYRIALSTRDRFRRLLAVGIATLIAAQALDNVSSTLGMMPITGVPLPFVSYGGSSLIVLLGSIGILVNIARGVEHERASIPRQDPRGDRGERNGRTRDSGARGRGRVARAGR